MNNSFWRRLPFVNMCRTFLGQTWNRSQILVWQLLFLNELLTFASTLKLESSFDVNVWTEFCDDLLQLSLCDAPSWHLFSSVSPNVNQVCRIINKQNSDQDQRHWLAAGVADPKLFHLMANDSMFRFKLERENMEMGDFMATVSTFNLITGNNQGWKQDYAIQSIIWVSFQVCDAKHAK